VHVLYRSHTRALCVPMWGRVWLGRVKFHVNCMFKHARFACLCGGSRGGGLGGGRYRSCDTVSCNFHGALDATLIIFPCIFPWNFYSALDATLLTSPWNFYGALDATLLASSSNF
jgi:hypothetical protein